jgi:hypothetical protein
MGRKSPAWENPFQGERDVRERVHDTGVECPHRDSDWRKSDVGRYNPGSEKGRQIPETR